MCDPVTRVTPFLGEVGEKCERFTQGLGALRHYFHASLIKYGSQGSQGHIQQWRGITRDPGVTPLGHMGHIGGGRVPGAAVKTHALPRVLASRMWSPCAVLDLDPTDAPTPYRLSDILPRRYGICSSAIAGTEQRQLARAVAGSVASVKQEMPPHLPPKRNHVVNVNETHDSTSRQGTRINTGFLAGAVKELSGLLSVFGPGYCNASNIIGYAKGI